MARRSRSTPRGVLGHEYGHETTLDPSVDLHSNENMLFHKSPASPLHFLINVLDIQLSEVYRSCVYRDPSEIPWAETSAEYGESDV